MAELEFDWSYEVENITESPLLLHSTFSSEVSLDSLGRPILPDSPLLSNSFLSTTSAGASPTVLATSHSSSLYLLDTSSPGSAAAATLGSPGFTFPDTTLVLSPPLNFSTPHTQQSDDSLALLSQRSCCSQRCLAHLSVVEIERSRKWFDSRDRTRQNQFLLDSYQISGSASSHTPTSTVNILEGKQLCKKAYTSVLGISAKRYDRFHRMFRAGVMHYSRKPQTKIDSSKVCVQIYSYNDIVHILLIHQQNNLLTSITFHY